MCAGKVDVQTLTCIGRDDVSKAMMESYFKNTLGRFDENENCPGLVFLREICYGILFLRKMMINQMWRDK